MALEKYYQFDKISKINTYLRIISTQIIIAFFSFLHLFTDLGNWSGFIFLSLVVLVQIVAIFRGKKVFWLFLNLNLKEIGFNYVSVLKIVFALILVFYNNDILYGAILFIIFNEFLRFLYNRLYEYDIINKKHNGTNINLIKSGTIAEFDFIEFLILLLVLGLPFQEFIIIDLKLITFLIFSFYSLYFLVLVSPILFSQIYRLLNQSLKVFFIIICFLFIITIQLKNLYSDVYPGYFNDFPSTLKNLISIITGDIFPELNNYDTGLIALSFILFCFVGIILFTIFTAIMVDTTIENHKDQKKILGLYDGSYVIGFYKKDSTGKWFIIKHLKHKGKHYVKDVKEDEVVDPDLPPFDIENAYELIMSKNGVKGLK
ncbi:MAG: hypothetical protein P8M76_03195 [Flavobacteriaceae bacterium]|nr:hypothetical protein [Flavobacteriaceae bacterium]